MADHSQATGEERYLNSHMSTSSCHINTTLFLLLLSQAVDYFKGNIRKEIC